MQNSDAIPAAISIIMRRPRPGFHFSIENNFSAVKAFLASELSYRIHVCPRESRGVWRKIENGIYAFRNRGQARHVTGDVNYLGLFLPKKGTIQTVLDCGGLKNRKWFKRKLVEYFWIRIPLSRCQVAITITNQVKDEIESLIGPGRCDIRVIPLALHPDFCASDRDYQWDSPRVVLVGTAENKNLVRMLESLGQLAFTCHVTLCGEQSAEISRLLNASPITIRHVSGLSTADMAQIYRQSDVLLYASLYEGFGMPIIEAQACGTAVITSDREPMVSVSGPGGALFVNPDSVEDIVRALNTLFEDSQLRAEMVATGLINSQRYIPESIANEYSKLYLEVLAQSL